MSYKMPELTHARLVSAVTKYDAKLSLKDGNIYRLGIILRGIEQMEASGPHCCNAHMLYDHFNDRLLSAMEKSLGLKVSYGRGSTDSERRPIECNNGKL